MGERFRRKQLKIISCYGLHNGKGLVSEVVKLKSYWKTNKGSIEAYFVTGVLSLILFTGNIQTAPKELLYINLVFFILVSYLLIKPINGIKEVFRSVSLFPILSILLWFLTVIGSILEVGLLRRMFEGIFYLVNITGYTSLLPFFKDSHLIYFGFVYSVVPMAIQLFIIVIKNRRTFENI